ncbi:MAG: hypothetical protein DDT31_01319 [Syntrophomonadaceae bacterium]|nr:hypothetical protein [Bacillota bacterium]
MSVVAAVASVASAAIGAFSSISAGRAQARMAAYNARIANQNAELAIAQMDIAKKQKEIMAARHRRGVEKTLGAQRAAWSKAGVDMAGTPLLVAAETEFEADLDAMAIRYAATVEQGQLLAQAAGQRQEATLQRMAGRAAKTAGYIGAGTSLLTGAGQAAYHLGRKR